MTKACPAPLQQKWQRRQRPNKTGKGRQTSRQEWQRPQGGETQKKMATVEEATANAGSEERSHRSAANQRNVSLCNVLMLSVVSLVAALCVSSVVCVCCIVYLMLWCDLMHCISLLFVV